MPTSLMQTIEKKRIEMIQYGMKFGLSSNETIKTSQELDSLLNMLNENGSRKQ